jgi:hypothetical protein
MTEISANGNLYKRKEVLAAAEKVGLEYRTTCNHFLRREMMAGTRGVYDITLYAEPAVKVKKTKTKKVAKVVADKIAEPVDSVDSLVDDQDVELTDVLDVDLDGEFADETEMLEELID